MRNRPAVTIALLTALAVLCLGCDVHKKSIVKGTGSSGSGSSAASATREMENRAAAATQRLQDAQQNATTDQEKIDAYNQYEKERQAIADGAGGSANNDPNAPQNPPPPPPN